MTKVYVRKKEGEDLVFISVRAEGPGGMVGDLFEEVRPGESFGDFSYAELLAATADGGGPGYVDFKNDTSE